MVCDEKGGEDADDEVKSVLPQAVITVICVVRRASWSSRRWLGRDSGCGTRRASLGDRIQCAAVPAPRIGFWECRLRSVRRAVRVELRGEGDTSSNRLSKDMA